MTKLYPESNAPVEPKRARLVLENPAIVVNIPPTSIRPSSWKAKVLGAKFGAGFSRGSICPSAFEFTTTELASVGRRYPNVKRAPSTGFTKNDHTEPESVPVNAIVVAPERDDPQVFIRRYTLPVVLSGNPHVA